MQTEIERIIINYCSPVLMGFKPAALFTLQSENCLECLSGILPPDITLMVLRKNGHRISVIVFDKQLLEKAILNETVLSLLKGMGYPEEHLSRKVEDKSSFRLRRDTPVDPSSEDSIPRPSTAEADSPIFVYLNCLKKKLETFQQFPHEIGFFLGYPIDDVLGFVKHKGQNYKLCGYWKVYGNIETAKNNFYCYELCRKYMSAWLQKGGLSSLRNSTATLGEIVGNAVRGTSEN
ncbi:MAG: DUF3793 family protein [Treponema sp.]|nr:DUF3793 family protein [Treponema sp.]